MPTDDPDRRRSPPERRAVFRVLLRVVLPAGILVALAVLLALCAGDLSHASDTDPAAPGARVEDLLELGRRLNPGVAARALEAEAARAEVDAAGRFPDPMFETEFEDIGGTGSDERYVPDTLGRVKYSLSQTIPLWGKRGLEREVAKAEAGAADEQRRLAESDLAERIKVVFAEWYATEEAIRIDRALLRTVEAIAGVAQSRYGQGRGTQQDAIGAETESGRLQLDLVRLDARRKSAMARLNALLDRPAGAPLTTPRHLRPVPSANSVSLDQVLERALAGNPQLAVDRAETWAAERTVELVRRTWYPDLTLGLSVFDEDGEDAREFGGYEARIGFDVPLQWGLRRARERAARAKLAASRARREASAADLRAEIEEAWWALDAAVRGAGILQAINLPQADVLLRSTLSAYELGRADMPAVLLAEQGLRRIEREHVELQLEQQVRLAELERLIGGEL